MSTIAIDVDPYKTKPQTEPLRELESDRSLRLLVVGDFSGGQSTGKLLRVDRDNFDQILSTLAPRVEVAFGNGQFGDTELVFHSLADFSRIALPKKRFILAPARPQGTSSLLRAGRRRTRGAAKADTRADRPFNLARRLTRRNS